MYLGKVIGRVVSTIKDQGLDGRTLLLVRRVPNGPVVVAVDAVGAGAGETVYVCRGREASFAFKPADVPTEASVVAIVDTVAWGDRPMALQEDSTDSGPAGGPDADKKDEL